MKRICGIIIILLLSCCSCSPKTQQIPELLASVKVKPDTAVVQYENVSNLTSITGCVLPYSEPLTFAVDGTVGSVLVLPGQSVKKGDVLASLNTKTLETQLDSLKKQLLTAQSEAALKNRNQELEIEICQLKLESQNDAYEKELAQLDLQQAQLNLKQAKEQQAFEQKQLADSVKNISAQLESATIRAPFSGIVTWISAKAINGSAITAKTAMFYLSDTTRLCVRTDRISPSILEPCDRIYAVIGASEFELTARESSVSDDLFKMLNEIDLTTTFDFKDSAAATTLTSGQNALVCYRSGYRENVLCVPTTAIFRDSDGSYVYRMDGAEKTHVAVETGAVSTLRTEITSGLSEGDVVYVKD